ncbi:MAG: class I SAM-dependent methyltransferase [Candidatus Lokiarchaeota archaeon]
MIYSKLNTQVDSISKTKQVYNKHAKSYDKESFLVERIFTPERELFNTLRGKGLEIGVGTGKNLVHYDSSVDLTVLDFSPEMLKITELRIKKFHLNNVKRILEGDIESLGSYFKKDSFDFVTSTCVFCSVPNPIKGLKEIKHILKPEGYLVQIEHGLSNNILLNSSLRILDPLTTRLRGFHLIRDQISNLKSAGFKIIKYRNVDRIGMVKTMISKPN